MRMSKTLEIINHENKVQGYNLSLKDTNMENLYKENTYQIKVVRLGGKINE